MARSDYAALITESASEYLAHTELQRFGLIAYLPQFKKRQHLRHGQFVMRHYPLFPRYLFVRYADAHHPSIRLARGISRNNHLLADADGRPWRAPCKAIEAVKQAEINGLFDEILHKGDAVTFTYGVLAMVRSVLASDASTAGMVDVITPLFGGARARVDSTKMVSA
ncbi:MAG: hypothetical protein EHM67_00060 [Hyphomicrobiaceae bacterium]|jgi:hypothetical protein|nr:MAG: hypothetical protein EHM67_00060 [Hyphomicrobiaceae bacterium]